MVICLNKVKNCGSWYRLSLVLVAIIYFAPTYLHAQKQKEDKFEKKSFVGKQKDESYIVPTSQIIDPAGTTITFSGRPMDMALNPGETILAVKNLKDILFFDASNHSIKQTLTLPEGGNSFTGIAWSDNGQKVWTTDTRGYLRSAKLQVNGSFIWEDQILLPSKFLPDGSYASENEILEKSSRAEKGRQNPGGFAIDEGRGLIYITLNLSNAVGIVNIKTGKFEKHIPVGVAPYSIIIKDNKAYVTNWGGRLPVKGDKTAMSAGTAVVINAKTGIASSGTVSVIDLNTRKVSKEIKIHLHPSGMILHPDGSRLYVANANSDLVCN